MIGVETALPIALEKMASGLRSPLCFEAQEPRAFQGIGELFRLLKSLEEISFFRDRRYSKVRKIPQVKDIQEPEDVKGEKDENRTRRLSHVDPFYLLVESRDFIWTWLISLFFFLAFSFLSFFYSS